MDPDSIEQIAELIEQALRRIQGALDHEGDTAGYSFLDDDEGRQILTEFAAALREQREAGRAETIAHIGLSTGRWCLHVGPVIVAIEADPCRDPQFAENKWNESNLREAARLVNEYILRSGAYQQGRGAGRAEAQPVNWEASYHQACDDADAYKTEVEKRATKLEQNWRSCQHNEGYLRERLAEAQQQVAALTNDCELAQEAAAQWRDGLAAAKVKIEALTAELHTLRRAETEKER